MKRLSWKYMAGLVDGQGIIELEERKNVNGEGIRCHPRLRIILAGEPGKQMIADFVANFGGSLYSGEVPQGNWQQAHTWVLMNATYLRKFLQNIVKHLKVKREQARFAIWWIDRFGKKQVPDEVRRFAHDELRAMKADPQRLSERASAQIERMMRQSGAE